MTSFPTVISAEPGEGMSVRVLFSDGEERVADVGSLVETGGVFARLSDREFFEGHLCVMNGTVAWDVSGDGDEARCIDLDPIKIYETVL